MLANLCFNRDFGTEAAAVACEVRGDLKRLLHGLFNFLRKVLGLGKVLDMDELPGLFSAKEGLLLGLLEQDLDTLLRQRGRRLHFVPRVGPLRVPLAKHVTPRDEHQSPVRHKDHIPPFVTDVQVSHISVCLCQLAPP
uniref:Putative vacuolar protein n=1 Tax=Ixodes ricinus TaxID=34613 RepID=A0A0K8RAS5_IXORI